MPKTVFLHPGLPGLRWLLAMFIGCAGALMLVVPNRFAGPGFDLLRPGLVPLGIAFFAIGTALAVATVFGSTGPLPWALQTLVGAALLLLAAGFIQAGNLATAARFVVLGLGALGAPFLSLLVERNKQCEPFALLVGLATAATGLLLPVASRQGSAFGHDPRLTAISLAFTVSGIALAVVQLLRSAPAPMQWMARASVAASFAAFLLITPLSAQSWLGLLYYSGFGIALLASPLVARLFTAGPTSLAAQLGVVVMLASAVPLVTIVTIIANRQQDVMREQSLQSGQTLAAVLADDVAGFARRNYEIVSEIADTPALLDMTRPEQTQLLRQEQRLHPDVFAVSIYDAAGQSIARGDDLPAVNRAGERVLENARQTNDPTFETIIGRNSGVPTFIFGAPIDYANGEFAGLATISVPSERWTELLKRASGTESAYLVSDDGHVLAHPNPAVNATFSDFSARPGVRALLDSTGASGSFVHDSDSGGLFVAFARVPGIGGVVVEQSAEAVLAPVYSGRELTLKILVIILLLANVLGLLIARSLAAPLAKLAAAAEELASGNTKADLPHSRVGEVQHLATIFGAMRDSLRLQTQETQIARQEALDKSQQLQAVLAGIANGVTAQSPNGQLLYANDAAAHMTGFDNAAELLAAPQHDPFASFDVLDEDGRPVPADEQPGRVALRGQLPAPALMWRRAPGTGEERWILVTSRPLLNSDGKVEMTINVMQDVTAGKRTEREKAEFLAALAHDLKTPLTAIKGVSQLMLRRLQQGWSRNEDWLRGELERLDATSERMANLVTELSEIRYIGTAQGLELATATVDLGELSRQVAGELQSTTTRHTIGVYAPEGPLAGLWDGARLGRMLANLIENAIKYSPDGGDIDVELEQAGDQVRITVRDQGIGIPKAELTRIFERFQRGSNVPDSISGTGVGLAYARWVVAQHHGQMHVQSTPGQGSAFIVELPLNARVQAAPEVVPA